MLPARFWSKIDKNGPVHPVLGTRCWLWTGSKTDRGYGKMKVAGHMQYVHRLMWEETYGKLLSGLLCCHHCDVRACVNPAHLFCGDHQDNMDDMVSKGRQGHREGGHGRVLAPMHGSAHPAAKLNEEAVRAIRREYTSSSVSQRDLAARYGVSQPTIWRVLAGEGWVTARGVG